MININQGSVYEHPIETLFHEFFEMHGIDIDGQYKSVEPTRFSSCLLYIYKNLFKPDKNTVRKNNRKSNLDYSDIDKLNEIADIFIELAMFYHFIPDMYNFSCLTGIAKQTQYTWLNGEYRGKIYYDTEGNVIHDIAEYKLNNRGEYSERPTTAHSDLVKKIREAEEAFVRLNLSGTDAGNMMLGNHDEEIGLLYERKDAQAKIEMMHKVRDAEEIMMQYAAYAEIGMDDK